MKARPLVLRDLARRDVQEAIDYCLDTAGQAAALRFIGALEAALASVARSPAAGSPRYADALGLPGLRSRRLPRHPYLIFYVEAANGVDVWRVSHAKRDIPAWLSASDGGGVVK